MNFDDLIRIKNPLIRCLLAEFYGTLILVFIAHSTGFSYVTASIKADAKNPGGNLMGITFGIGCAAFIALAVALPVSGGHLNPAITVAVASMGHFSWLKVPFYLLAQYLGGFVAASLLYATHLDTIELIHQKNNETGLHITAHLFGSSPGDHATKIGAFLNSFFATAVFLIGIAAVLDQKNMRAPKWFWIFGVPFVLMISIAAFGTSAGPNVNPAADIPTRLFAHLTGWDDVVWQSLGGHYVWLIGLLAPHLGAIFGIYSYRLFIGAHLPRDSDFTEEETELRVKLSRT